mgnify:FL=1
MCSSDLPFPKHFPVSINKIGDWPVFQPVVLVIPAVHIPQHWMIQLLLFDNRLHNIQRLLLTAGDFDQKESLILVLFLPPDQMGS